MTERRVKLEQHLQLLLLDLEVTKVFDWFAQVSSHTTPLIVVFSETIPYTCTCRL